MPVIQNSFLQLLLALKHPNIVACKEAFQQQNTLHILLELCSEGKISLVYSPHYSQLIITSAHKHISSLHLVKLPRRTYGEILL